jgi:hypothetical protein
MTPPCCGSGGKGGGERLNRVERVSWTEPHATRGHTLTNQGCCILHARPCYTLQHHSDTNNHEQTHLALFLLSVLHIYMPCKPAGQGCRIPPTADGYTAHNAHHTPYQAPDAQHNSCKAHSHAEDPAVSCERSKHSTNLRCIGSWAVPADTLHPPGDTTQHANLRHQPQHILIQNENIVGVTGMKAKQL